MNVVLFREAGHEARARRELKPHRVFFCPAIKTVRLKHSIPKKTFDYCIISSANTLKYLKSMPKADHYVFIGAQTANAAKLRAQKTVLKSDSRELIRFFKSQKKGSIVYPRSAIGDPKAIGRLRRQGHRVLVRRIYTTNILNIKNPLQLLLKKHKIDAFFLTSPSTARAVIKSLRASDRKKKIAVWVAIGMTTAWSLRRCGAKVIVAAAPSLKGMRTVLKGRS